VETTVISCSTSQGPRVAPGEPHLLAGGVEGDGQAGHHPVAGAERLLLLEQRGLGVDKGGGAAVGDRDALGLAGGARGEDDPGVVAGAGPAGAAAAAGLALDGDPAVGADDGADPGLAEHQGRPLVRVLEVDGHVGGPGGEDGEDCDVEVGGPGRHPDADPVAGADTGGGERGPHRADLGGQGAVAQHGPAVVQRGLVGVLAGGLVQDVNERAGGRGPASGEQGEPAGSTAELRCRVVHGRGHGSSSHQRPGRC
jgi:hypothetical protein